MRWRIVDVYWEGRQFTKTFITELMGWKINEIISIQITIPYSLLIIFFYEQIPFITFRSSGKSC